MDAMAWAIRVASWLLMAAPIAAGGWLGHRVLKNRWGLNAGMTLGAVVGLALVLRSFQEPLSQGNPTLQITVPSNFAHESVIVISDSSATQEVIWSGGHALLAVPKSGVVRLKTLGVLDGHEVDARLDRKAYSAYGTLNLDGARLTFYNFAYDRKEPALDLMPQAELAKYVREREAER
jgi:hypothetical protein